MNDGEILEMSSQNAVNMHTWDKIFKNRPSKICGRQPSKNLK